MKSSKNDQFNDEWHKINLKLSFEESKKVKIISKRLKDIKKEEK